MRVEEQLQRLGGVASASELRRHTSWPKIRVALRRGHIVRDGHGSYALPSAKTAVRAANALNGVLCLRSAAQHHGWKMKHPPATPAVAVPRKRNIPAQRRQGLQVWYVDLSSADVLGIATSYIRTVMDCAARLPFDEALAIADSAMRCGHVAKRELLVAAEAMPDRYRARCLRVAWHADGRAANPVASVLRAVALDVPGLYVVPQEWTDDVGYPDLVDKRLRLVIEAESFEFHGKRKALYDDCERYNAFAMKGWWVIRFAWEHVMFEPEYVCEVLTRMVRQLAELPRVGARTPA
jgi:hypothetical protein